MNTKKYMLGPGVTKPVNDQHGHLIDDECTDQAVENVHRALGGRPTLSGTRGSSPQVTFRLSSELRAAAERAADAEGVSLSEYAREALEERLHRAN